MRGCVSWLLHRFFADFNLQLWKALGDFVRLYRGFQFNRITTLSVIVHVGVKFGLSKLICAGWTHGRGCSGVICCFFPTIFPSFSKLYLSIFSVFHSISCSYGWTTPRGPLTLVNGAHSRFHYSACREALVKKKVNERMCLSIVRFVAFCRLQF